MEILRSRTELTRKECVEDPSEIARENILLFFFCQVLSLLHFWEVTQMCEVPFMFLNS